MKLKKVKKLLPAGIILMLAAGCTNDSAKIEEAGWNSIYLTRDVLYPKDSKVKRILQVNSDRTHAQVLTEYEYDSAGRTAKAIHAGEYYDVYEYNEKEQLTRISTYSNSTSAQTRLTTYAYDAEGNRIKEQVEYLDSEYGYTVHTLYIYENGQLAESRHFNRENRLDYIIRYEYDASGLMVRELFSVPEIDEAPLVKKYLYQDGLLVYVYSEYDSAYTEQRIYDLNGNLIELILDIPGLSSLSTVRHFYEIRRYEY
jgi:YD repeat-containing protein